MKMPKTDGPPQSATAMYRPSDTADRRPAFEVVAGSVTVSENELVAIIWGRGSLYTSLPSWLQGHVTLFTGSRYPLYRLVILGVGLAVAVGNTIGAGILRTPGDVASMLQTPVLFLGVFLLGA